MVYVYMYIFLLLLLIHGCRRGASRRCYCEVQRHGSSAPGKQRAGRSKHSGSCCSVATGIPAFARSSAIVSPMAEWHGNDARMLACDRIQPIRSKVSLATAIGARFHWSRIFLPDAHFSRETNSACILFISTQVTRARLPRVALREGIQSLQSRLQLHCSEVCSSQLRRARRNQLRRDWRARQCLQQILHSASSGCSVWKDVMLASGKLLHTRQRWCWWLPA